MRTAFILTAAAALVSAQLRIDTPTTLTECQPALIKWSGGTPPYFPSVIPGGQPAGAALKSFPETRDTQLTWNVDIASPTQVTMKILDSTGAINYAEQVSIQAGPDKSCIGASGSSGNSTSSSARASGSSAAASVSSGAAVVSGSASSLSSAAASGASSVSRAASSVSSGVAASGSSSSSGTRPSASSGAATTSSAAALPFAEPKVLGGLVGVIASFIGAMVL